MASPSGGDGVAAARYPCGAGRRVPSTGPRAWRTGTAYARRPRRHMPGRYPQPAFSRLCRVGFAGGEAFDEPELEPLAPGDVEAFGVYVAKRAAQVVLALQRHADDLGGPLDGADWP